MTKPRFKFIVAVHAFFIRDGKVLLLERANTNYKDGWFSVPAGHVDGGESIATAMSREISEEVGITFSEPMEPTHAMHRLISKDEERIDYFFLIKDWVGEPRNLEPHKCAQLQWAECQELPEKTIPYIRFALGEVLAGRAFSEFSEK